jgi:hypothetical protein
MRMIVGSSRLEYRVADSVNSSHTPWSVDAAAPHASDLAKFGSQVADIENPTHKTHIYLVAPTSF